MLLGPTDPEARPEVSEVVVRRYRCTSCGAVVTVAPRGLWARFRYRPAAIAWALCLWWLGTTSAGVRERVSPFSIVGDEARRCWHSLRRWVRQVAELVAVPVRAGPRKALATVLQRLTTRAPSGIGDLVADAVDGAAFVDAHRCCTRGPEVPTI